MEKCCNKLEMEKMSEAYYALIILKKGNELEQVRMVRFRFS
jgi:hypothetical protein